MHTAAVLEPTRKYFHVESGASIWDAFASANKYFTQSTTAQKVPPQTDIPKKVPQPRKPYVWLTSVVLAPAALGAAAYESWSVPNDHSVAAERIASDSAEMTTVSVARPTQDAASNIVLPATFRPWQSTTLHARVSGYLAAWHTDLGANVKAGDLMAEIETPELDQELATAQALVQEAIAATAQARAERIEAEADLKAAEAQLVKVKAEVELAKSQLVRREDLLQRKIISREEFDTFATQFETRTSEVSAAESDVIRRRANLNTRDATIEARVATVNSRKAAVDRLRELQSFKKIVAPFDGVVTRRSAEVGMLVTAGQGALFALEDVSRVRVQLNVPQSYASQAKQGVSVHVRIPESNLANLPGQISRIAESVDASSRTMLAEIELGNESKELQPGIYAQVTLSTTQSGVWTIGSNTLSMRVDGPHVAVVDDQNRVEIRRITLGRHLGNRIVAVEGIRGDERLIVNPSDSLVAGDRVQVSHAVQEGTEVAQR